MVPTKVAALLAAWSKNVPTPNVTTSADGTITIPAAAYSSKHHGASLTVMKSAWGDGQGEQLLHGGCSSPVGPPCLDPASSSFNYTLSDVRAGTYFLTANITYARQAPTLDDLLPPPPLFLCSRPHLWTARGIWTRI